MTALSVVRTRRGTLKDATLTQLLVEVDDVLNQGLVVSTKIVATVVFLAHLVYQPKSRAPTLLLFPTFC